jgi:hypothetical protein
VGDEVTLVSDEDYLAAERKLSIDAYVIYPSGDMAGLDLVAFLAFCPHIFASEQLVGALKTESITGLEYHETNILMS